MGRAQLASQERRNLDAHAAVHEDAVAREYGLEQARVRATGADRKNHIAGFAERHGFAAAQVGRDDAKWYPHVLKTVNFEESLEETLRARFP